MSSSELPARSLLTCSAKGSREGSSLGQVEDIRPSDDGCMMIERFSPSRDVWERSHAKPLADNALVSEASRASLVIAINRFEILRILVSPNTCASPQEISYCAPAVGIPSTDAVATMPGRRTDLTRTVKREDKTRRAT